MFGLYLFTFRQSDPCDAVQSRLVTTHNDVTTRKPVVKVSRSSRELRGRGVEGARGVQGVGVCPLSSRLGSLGAS